MRPVYAFRQRTSIHHDPLVSWFPTPTPIVTLYRLLSAVLLSEKFGRYLRREHIFADFIVNTFMTSLPSKKKTLSCETTLS